MAGRLARLESRGSPRLAPILAVLVLPLASVPALAAEVPSASGQFDPAPFSLVPPSGSAVTPLADGRVAVVGGYTWSLEGLFDDSVAAEGMSSAVEVWDPATGESMASGSLVEAREGHTATLLQDGRVLIVGGAAWGHLLASAEVWDPATGESMATGPLARDRRDHTATLLADGRVLIVGGDGYGRQSRCGWPTVTCKQMYTHASAETWDPTTGEFSPAGSLEEARDRHTATLLSDGRVLIVGGTAWYGQRTPLRMVEVWDPTTSQFARTGSIPEARLGHTATLLADGRVVIVGGGWDKAPPKTVLVWDPRTEEFSPAGSMGKARLYHSATLLPDGRVLIIGGTNIKLPPNSRVFASSVLWDPATGEFAPAGALGEARAFHTALPLDDGRVLVVGGEGDGFTEAQAEIWAPR